MKNKFDKNQSEKGSQKTFETMLTALTTLINNLTCVVLFSVVLMKTTFEIVSRKVEPKPSDVAREWAEFIDLNVRSASSPVACRLNGTRRIVCRETQRGFQCRHVLTPYSITRCDRPHLQRANRKSTVTNGFCMCLFRSHTPTQCAARLDR